MRPEEIQALMSYRMQRSEESLRAAEIMLRSQMFAFAMNRIYYAMFYAVQAVLALKGVSLNEARLVEAILDNQGARFGVPPESISTEHLTEPCKTACRREGRSVAAFVRDAVTRTLARQDAAALFQAFTLVGEDMNEVSVEFAHEVQREAVLKGEQGGAPGRYPGCRLVTGCPWTPPSKMV
jgi:hypothetical protein